MIIVIMSLHCGALACGCRGDDLECDYMDGDTLLVIGYEGEAGVGRTDIIMASRDKDTG